MVPIDSCTKILFFIKLKLIHTTVYASQVSLDVRCGLPLSGKLCLVALQQPIFELQKLYKRLFMYLIASFSTVVNEATGDNSSANDSPPSFSPLVAIQAEGSNNIVNEIPGAMVKVPF